MRQKLFPSEWGAEGLPRLPGLGLVPTDPLSPLVRLLLHFTQKMLLSSCVERLVGTETRSALG